MGVEVVVAVGASAESVIVAVVVAGAAALGRHTCHSPAALAAAFSCLYAAGDASDASSERTAHTNLISVHWAADHSLCTLPTSASAPPLVLVHPPAPAEHLLER